MVRDWESWFQTAAQPASTNEEAKRGRTEERIRQAIRASSEIPSSVKIYVKGSYKTNTNARQDSDVDVCVEWQDFSYDDTWGNTEGMGSAELKYTPATDLAEGLPAKKTDSRADAGPLVDGLESRACSPPLFMRARRWRSPRLAARSWVCSGGDGCW
jgi:nucleotidyltransferase-like protein